MAFSLMITSGLIPDSYLRMSQVLMRSGWMPSNDIEIVLVQIKAAIQSDENARSAQPTVNELYLHY